LIVWHACLARIKVRNLPALPFDSDACYQLISRSSFALSSI
jgi:hypothetical protein